MTTRTLRRLLHLLNTAHPDVHKTRVQAVLDHIRRHPDQGTLQIARALGRHPAGVARIIDHLELAGLITGHWHHTPAARRVYTATRTRPEL